MRKLQKKLKSKDPVPVTSFLTFLQFSIFFLQNLQSISTLLVILSFTKIFVAQTVIFYSFVKLCLEERKKKKKKKKASYRSCKNLRFGNFIIMELIANLERIV